MESYDEQTWKGICDISQKGKFSKKWEAETEKKKKHDHALKVNCVNFELKLTV